jgi:hypothetical protein
MELYLRMLATCANLCRSIMGRWAAAAAAGGACTSCSIHLPINKPNPSEPPQTLQSSADLKTNACCTAKPPPKEVREVLAKVPGEVVARYYGCGSPFPPGLSGQPLAVLDLGCGSGRDCYVCAALVGPQGRVTGEGGGAGGWGWNPCSCSSYTPRVADSLHFC